MTVSADATDHLRQFGAIPLYLHTVLNQFPP